MKMEDLTKQDLIDAIDSMEDETMYPVHLEFIPQDLIGKVGCEWEDAYTDYDGSSQGAPCGEGGEVWLVYEDPFEGIMGAEFCRRHGNIALLEWRSTI